jgi:hypothetical protein
MNSKWIAVVMMLMFAVAVGAGVVTGKLSARLPATPAAPVVGTLSDELQLDPQQRAAMQKIWESAQRTSRDCAKAASLAQKEQDDALMALLNDEQKAKYAAVNQQTQAKIAALDLRRRAAFSDAVEQTSGILSEPQRKTYKLIIHDRWPDMALDRSLPEPGAAGSVPVSP